MTEGPQTATAVIRWDATAGASARLSSPRRATTPRPSRSRMLRSTLNMGFLMIRKPGGVPTDDWLRPAAGWASPHSAGAARAGGRAPGLPAQSGHGTIVAVWVRVATRAGHGRSTSEGLLAEFQHQLLPGISRYSRKANGSAAEVQGNNQKLPRVRSRTPLPTGPYAVVNQCWPVTSDGPAWPRRGRWPQRGIFGVDLHVLTFCRGGRSLVSLHRSAVTSRPRVLIGKSSLRAMESRP